MRRPGGRGGGPGTQGLLAPGPATALLRGARPRREGCCRQNVPEGWTEEPASGTWDQKFVGDGIELQIAGSFSRDPNATAAIALSGESLDSTEVKAVLDSMEFTKPEGNPT